MAIGIESKTISTDITWKLELFPFNSEYPAENEFGNALPDMGSFGNAAVDFLSKNAGLLAVTGGGEQVSMGIRHFSFTRSKESANNSANLSLVGPPPSSAYPGVWCLLVAINPDSGAERIRFIGQIASVSVSYQTNANGLVTVVSNYVIREWSSVLSASVRVESLTTDQSFIGPTAYNAALASVASLGKDVWEAVTTASYNPFQMATLILQLLGAISSNNSKETIKELADLNYYKTASRMPSVPTALCSRLGIKLSQGSDPTNVFGNGFVKFISGVRKDNSLFSFMPSVQFPFKVEDWDGVFNKNGHESLQSYINKHETKNIGRPVGSGISVLASINSSAWDLLTNYCDPGFNEFYTDILYEQDGNKEKAQPVFIFRDKPFLLNILKETFSSDLSIFSSFDTLPCVTINPATIVNFTFSNTILNSPNLIRLEWTDAIINAEYSKQQSLANGYKLLAPEMMRFGGNEYHPHVNFNILDKAGAIVDFNASNQWWISARDAVVGWYSYLYRMGNGVLTLKDDGTAYSVGHNVSFKFGNFTLVGHLDSFTCTVAVNDKGLLENNIQLNLSRIVQKLDNELTFIKPSHFGQLANPEVQPEAPDLGLGSDFGGVGGSLVAGASAIAGKLF